MKTLIATMLGLLMTSMFSAHAEEGDGWALTLVTKEDLIHLPVTFTQKEACTEVGVTWAKADGGLEGFTCAERPIFREGYVPSWVRCADGEGS